MKILSLLLAGIFVSCATASQKPPPLGNREASNSDLTLPPDNFTSSQRATRRLNASIETDKHINNASVQKWIVHFSTEGKEHFEEVLRRGSLYKKQIHAILEKFEVPTNLYYLALIESDFKVQARSVKQAAGIWQFMAPTGRNYGLRINDSIDERRDPLRSTVAAAIYLKNLKNVFDDWFLAMAAYNAGESRIMNSIIRSGTRDFWQLSEIGFIPRETRGYVPRFIAALIVAEHPERYGLKIDFPEQPNVVAVKIPSPVKLETIAETAGMSLKELQNYNPHILTNYTPTKFSSYRIWLPEHKNKSFAKLSQLEIEKITSPQISKHITQARKQIKQKSIVQNTNKIRTIAYEVRKGDNLMRIAQRFKMSLHRLKHLNSLKTSRLYVGQVIHVEPSGKQG
jgi:membrane-bound lytic murein transglycosylase D